MRQEINQLRLFSFKGLNEKKEFIMYEFITIN